MKRSKSDYSIQTVANALRLLREFRRDEELGVTELSRRLALHKNNVFRLLATLEEQGYVEQCRGSERYRLGVACVELGRAYLRAGGLTRLARPELEALARETGETAHLATLDHRFRVVHLDGLASDQLIGTVLRVGRSLDAHCSALGKALLASSESAALERFDRERIGSGGLPQRTAATIVDREKFFEHLRTVAGQGYAVDQEECASGLCCAAAPVHDHDGTVAGAISVSGPAFRLDERALHDRAAPLVVAAAQRLSVRLGWPGQPGS
jgi:DNA-binding IclR family transcriptional regulator